MAGSLFRFLHRQVARHRLKRIPFAGNAHLMRDIGCTPVDAPRAAFFHALPPR